MIIQSKIISFNILANRFTRYTTHNHRNEPSSLMRYRYLTIIKYLLSLNANIYFLQEVDDYFFDLINNNNIFNYKHFFISYVRCNPLEKEKNKTGVGLMTIINKKHFNVNNHLQDLLKPTKEQLINNNFNYKGNKSFIITFDHIFKDKKKKEEEKEEKEKKEKEPNQKKVGQLLLIKKNNKYFLLINCHFDGHPPFQDIRLEQFKHSIQSAIYNIKVNNIDGEIILAGDFNEPFQEDITTKYIKYINKEIEMKLMNESTDFTSHSKYNLNQETNEWDIINKKEKLDYILTTNFFSKKSENTTPTTNILLSSPNWNKKFDPLSLINNLKSNSENINWMSDHKVIEVILEYNIDSSKILKSLRKESFSIGKNKNKNKNNSKKRNNSKFIINSLKNKTKSNINNFHLL